MALDINNLKSEFASILSAANTTTAAFDLSTNMRTSPARPVQGVYRVNPNHIPIQASSFPFVTIFNDSKEIDLDTIAGDQLRGKRMAEMRFTVVGSVWQNQVTTSVDDKADEQITYLMENVEEVIRRNYRLNNTVLWSKPERVQYFSSPLDEGAHLRVGVMDLIVKAQY
jgi:hypothetical protein